MLKKILQKIVELFPPATYHSDLEYYLIKQRPQDVCHLEILQKEYERSFTRRLL